MPFDRRYQVQKFVACVKSSTGSRFMVFTTGDEKYYLFSQIHNGCTTGLQFPVAKKDLRNDIKRALAHGWGNCAMRPEDDGVPFRFLPPGATWIKREAAETASPTDCSDYQI